jgi:hypothetical protein
MDAVAITALLTALGSLSISILTHIKHSSCKNGSFEITTTESHTPTIQTPEVNFGSMIESVSRPPSPVHTDS